MERSADTALAGPRRHERFGRHQGPKRLSDAGGGYHRTFARSAATAAVGFGGGML